MVGREEVKTSGKSMAKKRRTAKLANAFRSNVNSTANHTKLESPLQKDNISITIAIPVTITFTVTATVTITYHYQHDH